MTATDPVDWAAYSWPGLDGGVAFDLGACLGENFGWLRAGGAAKVVGVEPEPGRFEHLQAQRLDPGVFWLVPAAVSDQTGEVELVSGPAGMLTSLPEWERDGRRTVPSVTVDQLAGVVPPDVVVVDVEGHEDRVMAGAARVLAEVRPTWLVEFHTRALLDSVAGTLTGAGYELEVVRHPHYPAGSEPWHGHGWIRALRPV